MLSKSLSSVANCDYCQALLLRVNNEYSTIKCKGCSAPLKLEGELSQLKILVCSYCQTAMDSEEEFKALYTYANIQKPNSSLEVGMRGEINGVEYTIVSLIVYKSRALEWLEFRLYSSTKGYLKLLKKEGNYILLEKFSKKIEKNIWLLKQNETFELEDKKFTIESFAFSEVYYALGNIDSKINKNQRNKQCFAKSSKVCFHSVYSKESIDYYLGDKIEGIEELFIS